MERAYHGQLKSAVSKKLCQFRFRTDRIVLALYNLSRILLEKRIRTELLRLDLDAFGEGEIYLACHIEKELVKETTQLFYRIEGVTDMECLQGEGRKNEDQGKKDRYRKGKNNTTNNHSDAS